MAAVQTFHAMTLGQSGKMYVQQHTPQQNCVIVSNVHQQPIKIKQEPRPLAPAPIRTTSVLVANNNNNDLRSKRKIQFMPYGAPVQQPASVARRNARERNRVKQVNNGFATLRQHIPAAIASALSPQASSPGRGASKKLSKVETLRMAVEYIRSLQQLLDDHESEVASTSGSSDHLLENRYYASSPESVNQFSGYPVLLPTPACSEASVSPTPSQSSDGSICATPMYTNNLIYSQENYENYDPKSPEDEELLDAIFRWQHDN